MPDGDRPLPASPSVQPGGDDYGSNIQIADLNALNAMLAIIRWKRWLGIYATHADASEIVYKLFLNEIRNGDVE